MVNKSGRGQANFFTKSWIRPCTRSLDSRMAGFDCQFVERPPEVFQTKCPVCLLILREPYQVSCCGKSFCRECIEAIKARSQPCPTCKRDRFECFHNKGLEQPLYGFHVFCSKKESGCAWEGELGQLDQHINSNPKHLRCSYTIVACVYCNKLHQRHEIERHQTSLCLRRPFTCDMCQKYRSTYEDVATNHVPVCKCRLVLCPNWCGADNLQHQHLEEHMLIHCPLSYVECEFSDAGCDAKLHRKDLRSHLTDNIVTHMSLLATENRKLKLQLQKQSQEISRQESQLKKQERDHLELAKYTRLHPSCVRVPPIDFLCPAGIARKCGTWLSEPVFSLIGGCEIQLKCEFTLIRLGPPPPPPVLGVSVHLLTKPVCKLCVTTELVDHSKSPTRTLISSDTPTKRLIGPPCGGVHDKFLKNDHLLFRITNIEEKNEPLN